MTIRAIIFDFGDVLMRSHDPRGRRQWEKRLDLEEGELDRIVFRSETMGRAMTGHATIDDVWTDIGAQFALNPADTQQLDADFWQDNQLDEQLIEFVRGLRPHYRTAILSDAWRSVRQIFTDTLGLGEVFDEIIISAEEGMTKPDPRIFNIALDRLQVNASETIFVDDQPANVEAARSLGVHAILFTNTDEVLACIQRMIADDG